MSNAVHRTGDPAPTPYEAALQQALSDIAAARARAASLREQLSAEDVRCAELGAVVQGLVSLLPAGRAEQYLRRLRELDAIPTVTGTKGGPAFNNVVQLLARQKQRDGVSEVTSTSVKEELVDKGPRHDAKEVDNVLSYLARTGQLQRISRGRYIIRDLNVALNFAFDFDEGEHGREDLDE